MADLNKWLQYYGNQANNVYGSQYAATNQNYDSQINDLTGQYNTVLGQDKQQLAAIPGQYQPVRNSSYLAYRKSMSALPAQMANAGYASGSGLAYDTAQGNNATWQKSVDTADQAQNTATQNQQNAMDNLTNTYQGNLGKLQAGKASALAAIDTAKQNWVTTQAQSAYNTEVSQEQAAAEAAAKLAAEQQAAAAKEAASRTSSSSGNSGYSDDTENVQAMLNQLGYSLAVDGYNGPATKAAVADFQTKYGLNADGVVGTATKKALANAMANWNNSAITQQQLEENGRLLEQAERQRETTLTGRTAYAGGGTGSRYTAT